VALHVLRFNPGTNAFSRGPADPIRVKDAGGQDVDCWVATALGDGRLVCSTFSYEQAGRIILADGDGNFLGEAVGGYGTTDLAMAPIP